MPVKMIETFELSCDNCDYVADMEESETLLFDNPEAAVKFALDNDWGYRRVEGIHWFSCPGCEGR